MDDIDNLIADNKNLLRETEVCLSEASPAPWHPKLPFDIAMGLSAETVCIAYEITQEELNRLFHTQAFRRDVSKHEQEIRENGISFRSKAKIQAEMYLEELHELILDAQTPASIRLNAIQSIVKWAGLEPKEEKQTAAVQINNNTKIEVCWGRPDDERKVIDI